MVDGVVNVTLRDAEGANFRSFRNEDAQRRDRKGILCTQHTIHFLSSLTESLERQSRLRYMVHDPPPERESGRECRRVTLTIVYGNGAPRCASNRDSRTRGVD